jgi:hypothetical protein
MTYEFTVADVLPAAGTTTTSIRCASTSPGATRDDI